MEVCFRHLNLLMWAIAWEQIFISQLKKQNKKQQRQPNHFLVNRFVTTDTKIKFRIIILGQFDVSIETLIGENPHCTAAVWRSMRSMYKKNPASSYPCAHFSATFAIILPAPVQNKTWNATWIRTKPRRKRRMKEHTRKCGAWELNRGT